MSRLFPALVLKSCSECPYQPLDAAVNHCTHPIRPAQGVIPNSVCDHGFPDDCPLPLTTT